ncbi:hypothetical protein Ahy_B02g060807 [Arachis hypogaea]|uniref:MULE transposase domain-containing protein n=1 Tax=Arachis hypogaea TaxID=3818 RepID=A0A445AJC8_ARAHY|nr:hypothetical protein Ahy_B02g060807 [Arachis hypogaea]
MQEMFSMYIESRTQIPFIELYIEFEQSEADQNIEREDYNSDSEEEFESNYEVVGSEGDEFQGDGTMEANVTDVANALENDHPFEEPSFMQTLDLEAMHAPEFPEYMNANGEFAVGMEFSFREAVIMAMKDYTIRRGVDYKVYESEPLTFYAKCLQYGSVSQDGNNHIVLIAYAIVEGETSDAWHFFLSNLRQHVVTRDGVGLISDRHESINVAVARIREYKLCYQRLREWGEAYTNWLSHIPRE